MRTATRWMNGGQIVVLTLEDAKGQRTRLSLQAGGYEINLVRRVRLRRKADTSHSPRTP